MRCSSSSSDAVNPHVRGFLKKFKLTRTCGLTAGAPLEEIDFSRPPEIHVRQILDLLGIQAAVRIRDMLDINSHAYDFSCPHVHLNYDGIKQLRVYLEPNAPSVDSVMYQTSLLFTLVLELYTCKEVTILESMFNVPD